MPEQEDDGAGGALPVQPADDDHDAPLPTLGHVSFDPGNMHP